MKNLIVTNGHEYLFADNRGVICLYDTDGNELARAENYDNYYHAIFYDIEGEHMDLFDTRLPENTFKSPKQVAFWLATIHPEI